MADKLIDKELMTRDEITQWVIDRTGDSYLSDHYLGVMQDFLSDAIPIIRQALEAERLNPSEDTKHGIREILRVVNSIRNFGMGTAYNDYVDKILALRPSEEETKKAERDRIKRVLEDFERISNVENYTRIMIPTEVLNKIFEH